MNKKITLCTLGLVSLLTLASCNNTSDNQKVLDSFNKINTKVESLKSVTTITKGNMVIASEEVNYNFKTLKKITTTKTLNEVTAETAWKVETIDSNFEVSTEDFKLKETSFDNLTLTETSLKGIVRNGSILSVFGVDDSNVNSDVAITFNIDSLKTKNVTGVILDYTSTNGNNVNIVNEYTLKEAK